MDLLIHQSKIDINKKIGRWTPLAFAVTWDNLFPSSIVGKLLLDTRTHIDINIVTQQKTALDLAQRQTTRNALRAHGAKKAAELNLSSSTNQVDQTQHNTQQPFPQNGQQQNDSSHSLSSNTDSKIKSHWYTSPSLLWFAATATCGACLYGLYNYFHAWAEEEADEDDAQDAEPSPAPDAPVQKVEATC